MKHSSDLASQTLMLDHKISITNASKVAFGTLRLAVSEAAKERCHAAHRRLQTVIDENRHVYGITTGFGPLANRLVSTRDGVSLQQNLIHHLASGVGPHFGWAESRAIMFARLMSILQGASGASPNLITTLVTLLNSSFAAAIPSRGTVGASGDLTPLAHMALSLQARGDFLDEGGHTVPAQQVFDSLSLAPLSLADRDGLALVNGTSAMTGLACLNTVNIGLALDWAVATTAIMAEVMRARTEAWRPEFGIMRPHPGQISVAAALTRRVAGSNAVIRKSISDRILPDQGFALEETAGQDAYSLRCAPQVIGAVADLAEWHEALVERELCSATDNPIFPDDTAQVNALHGGNFMGQHVGLASDAMANGIVVLAGLVERQIARITDEKLNNGLPAFLHRGQPGLNSGLMGAQVTATALLAEMRTIGPATIHSISTNGANQDVVSMGTIAARSVQEKLRLLSQIQAVMCIAVAQAVDIRRQAGDKDRFSKDVDLLYRFIRQHSAAIDTDRPLGREIETIATAISSTPPPDASMSVSGSSRIDR